MKTWISNVSGGMGNVNEEGRGWGPRAHSHLKDDAFGLQEVLAFHGKIVPPLERISGSHKNEGYALVAFTALLGKILIIGNYLNVMFSHVWRIAQKQCNSVGN